MRSVNACLLFFAAISLLFCPNVYAQGNPMLGALDNMKIIKDVDDANSVYTYEDVEPIEFDPYSVPDTGLVFVDELTIPNEVTKVNAEKYFNLLVPGTILSSSYNNVKSLLDASFYIAYGDKNNPRVIGKGNPQGFPYEYGPTNKPTARKFYLCMKENPDCKIVDRATIRFEPDSYFCCICGKSYLNGSQCINYTEHNKYYRTGIYTSFREKLLNNTGMITPMPAVTMSDGIVRIVAYRDRTPPHIKDCYGKEFPTLGSSDSNRAFTGDFYSMKDLTVLENKSEKVYVKVIPGSIDDCPEANSDWKNNESWEGGLVSGKNSVSSEPIDTSDKDSESGLNSGKLEAALQINHNYGYMRYTLFLQDTKGDGSGYNLNPGCASIIEDRPDICYGLPEGADLLSSWKGAKPWPYKENSVIDINNIDCSYLEDDSKANKGFIRITDNDLPNILIRITSSKDGKQLFFPPCVPPGDLRVVNSPEFLRITGIKNEDKYEEFVKNGLLRECNYYFTRESDSEPYYTIFDLQPSVFMNDSYSNQKFRFIKNSDVRFINQQFRIEDQSWSDTDLSGELDGQLIKNTDYLLGIRNGTWQRVVALIENNENSEFKILEDVEYSIDIWADDSVKWANADPDSGSGLPPLLDMTMPMPTGIKNDRVELILNVPNQSPKILNRRYEIDLKTREDNNGIKVVFREPTEKIKTADLPDIENSNFPSITVRAEDISGLKREVLLFFRIEDEKTNIRTIQRKHEGRKN